MNSKFKIFLATDYSEAVMNAERYAFELAKKTGSYLTIVHVYETPFSLPIEADEYIKASERLRKFELQKLKVHCETLLRKLEIKQNELNWESIVLEGNVGKEIQKEAEQNHPDLIITGIHNLEEAAFLGPSHTWNIIKRSDVPILSIPPYALLTDIKKIVFATDYRDGEIRGIQSVAILAKKFNAELIILHITNRTMTKDYESVLFKKFKADVQKKVHYDRLSLRLIYSEDIAEGLNDFCISAEADWLVVSHSKPSFFENILFLKKSITKEMSIKTHIPLLSVPDYYALNSHEETDIITESVIFKEKDYTPG